VGRRPAVRRWARHNSSLAPDSAGSLLHGDPLLERDRTCVGVAAHEVRDQTPDLDQLWPSGDVRRLVEQLAADPASLEAWVVGRAASRKIDPLGPRVLKMANAGSPVPVMADVWDSAPASSTDGAYRSSATVLGGWDASCGWDVPLKERGRVCRWHTGCRDRAGDRRRG